VDISLELFKNKEESLSYLIKGLTSVEYQNMIDIGDDHKSEVELVLAILMNSMNK
jgi:hypothetical protein